MMTFTQAQQMLFRRIGDFTDIDPSRISFEQSKQEFIVPANGLWCRVEVLGSQSLVSGLADQPKTRRISIVQITCYARLNTGVLELNQLADAWLSYLEYYRAESLECLNGEVIKDENQDFTIRHIRVPFRVN